MTGQPAVNVGDYVIARHKATILCGEVKAIRATPQIETDDGMRLWFDPDDWSFELAERPQPPLKDGVYQKHGAIRMRSEGRWFVSKWEPDPLGGSDSIHSDWGYVGPEVSR